MRVLYWRYKSVENIVNRGRIAKWKKIRKIKEIEKIKEIGKI